jgi:glycosyltransferase involved in cell wall biosynthesis
LLEAMGWRLPVVASRIDEIAEVARDGQEADLVPVRDPIALADAVARILENPEHASALAVAARRRVLDRFTLDRMIDRHAALYDELIRGKFPRTD